MWSLGCVCVCTVCIDVKLLLIILYYIYSRGHRDLQLWPLPTKLHTGDQVSVPAVPPLGAFKTQLGGTYNILYRCCFILSLSNVILHMYIYIYIYNFHCRLIRFPSHLHVTGFGSWRITEMIHSCLVWFLWWLQHGAIGPSEATLFRVNVDWIDLRIYTFELVIRLSTVKLLALPFCAFDEVPRLLWSQGSSDLFFQVKPVRTARNFFFITAACVFEVQHDIYDKRQQACPFPAGVVSLVSGEVKHIVHLIRWNLTAVICHWGTIRPRSRCREQFHDF